MHRNVRSYHHSISRSSFSQSLSPSLSVTSLSITSSSDSFDDYLALGESCTNILNNIQKTHLKKKKKKKQKKIKKSKTKTVTNTKRKVNSELCKNKHRHSKKQTIDNSQNNISNAITPIRKYIQDEYNRDVRFSYNIVHTTLKTSINIMIENLSGYKLYKIRMKWYKINNKTQTYLLSKEIDEYDYKRTVIHLYNDMDDYQYDNNTLIVKLKYRFVELDEWEDPQIRYYKSDKLKIELK